EPVSVRMAKEQDLPLNPLKISGACGRLMCCLKYEHPLYQEFNAKAPVTGTQVETPLGDGTVVGHNVPSDTVVVRLAASGRRCACSRADVCSPRQQYEEQYEPTRQRRRRRIRHENDADGNDIEDADINDVGEPTE
ncbi:MAG TPA: regulatory iron-sulfur-containing complex subunit RicT, partial [Kribbellaceae bacterium]|nr:regulatory iron-sulfur-containing complex subunit RicT [Kribbellaceae bacterium]